MSTTLDLYEFPEELLESILSHCLIAALSQPPRPSWHRTGSTPSPPHPIRGRLAVLLVCKQFLRISTPLYYHTIHILSAKQLHRLLSGALRPKPQLASYIRRIVFSGIWADGGEVLRMSGGSLRTLDVTLDTTQLPPNVQGDIRDLDAEEFCDGLKSLTSLTHIMIRKPNDVYITRSKPRYVLSEIATAMQGWDSLEHADIVFRMSDDSGTTVSNATKPVQQGPITALTEALSTRPNLHTFSTLLPSIWNEAILRVSTNPSLERIVLGDGSHAPGYSRYAPRPLITQWIAKDLYAAPVSASLPTQSSPLYFEPTGIMGTGLFMLQAKKYARLTELIRSGTCISRTRAQTLDTQGPGPINFAAASTAAHHWASSPTHITTSTNTFGRITSPHPLSSPTTPTSSTVPNRSPRSAYEDQQGAGSRLACSSSTAPSGSRVIYSGYPAPSTSQSMPKRRMTGA